MTGANTTIRIGTRGSKLAMWQAAYVERLLVPSGYRTEIVQIQTKGDRLVEVAIDKIGSKGVFTQEIENALFDGTIDIAVHSAKDLLSELDAGLEILAYAERTHPEDVFVSRNMDLYPDLEGIRIGTSSTRRVAFIRHFHPYAKVVPVRGNLQTRIEKMDRGDCDALILAYAGIERMGFTELIAEKLSPTRFIPAVGQGSIAVECSVDLDPVKKVLLQKYVNHGNTETCVKAERAFLRTLQGGCTIPAFGFAELNNKTVSITCGVISLDGKKIVRVKKSGAGEGSISIGESAGKEVLRDGGKTILDEIRGTAY